MGNGTTTRIDHIAVGDWVEATDPATGKTVAEPVTAVIVTLTDHDYTDTTIRTADGGTATVTSTQHHRYWDVTRHAWVDASHLHPGDLLRQPDGTWTTVLHTRNYHAHTTTYNLTVQTLHTYYVLAGNTPVLVHNSGGACKEVVLDSFGSFEQARNKALDLLGEIDPAARQPYIGRLESSPTTYGTIPLS